MAKQNSTKSAKSADTKITVNEARCKRCGICAAFCPVGVFVEDEFGLPAVKYPEKCIMCMLCVVRCPDFAVEVESLKEKKAPRTYRGALKRPRFDVHIKNVEL